MKKEQKNTKEQDIEKEDNKEENNGRKNSKIGIMIGEIINQSNQSEEHGLKKKKTETRQVSGNYGLEYPLKMKHGHSKHVDNQSNKKEEELTNTSQELEWDPGVGIDPLTQLKEVEVKLGANMGRKTHEKNRRRRRKYYIKQRIGHHHGTYQN